MAIQWKLYTDAALTTPFIGTLSIVHYTDFSDNPQDFVLYLGNIDGDPADNGAWKLVRADDSDILLTITDTTPGSGHETTEIKLATSLLDLDTAIAGAALNLGSELISGVTAAQPVHIRVTNAVSIAGTSLELGTSINETVRRSAV